MQKGTATLLLLILVLLIIGLISVFLFGLIKLPVSKKPIEILPTQFKTLTPVPKLPTYNNQKLGLEFQYSDMEFSVKEDSEEELNKRGNGDFRKNFKGYVGYEPGIVLGAVAVLDKNNDFDKSPLTIWAFNNINNLTIEQWFDKYWYYPFLWGVFDYTSKGHVTPDSEATISGQLAKYKIVAYQPGSPKYLYLSNNGKMYLFRIIGNAGDQILSTFKFLDQASAERKVCGGFGGEKGQFACPGGFKCKYPEPMYPDAQGQCVKSE